MDISAFPLNFTWEYKLLYVECSYVYNFLTRAERFAEMLWNISGTCAAPLTIKLLQCI